MDYILGESKRKVLFLKKLDEAFAANEVVNLDLIGPTFPSRQALIATMLEDGDLALPTATSQKIQLRIDSDKRGADQEESNFLEMLESR